MIAQSEALKFGDFRLEVKLGLLFLEQNEVEIAPQAAATLRVFLEHPGEVLSKDEIRKQAWGENVHVDVNAIERQISDIRRVLKPKPDGGPWIETLSRRGYRFNGVVERLHPPEVLASPWDEADTTTSPPQAVTAPVRRRSWLTVTATLALLTVAYAIGARSRIPALRPSGRRSIVLFSFHDVSGRAPWLSAALPDLLRIELTSSEVRIVPQDVARRTERDLGFDRGDKLSRKMLRSISRLTGADVVISGSYIVGDKNSDGHVLQVVLEIHDASAGRLVAEQKTTAPDLSEAAARVGAQIRAALHLTRPDTLEAERAALPGTQEGTESYYAGLRKLHSFDENGAADLLEKAAIIEPGSPRVHSDLAEAWAALGYQARARAEARKAMTMADALPQPEKLEIKARYHALAGEWARVIEIERSLWMVFPDEIEHGLALADGQTADGDPKAALETIAQIRRSSPHASDPRIDLAEAAAREASSDFSGEQAAAGRAYEKAVQIGARSGMANALLRGSWASYMRGNWSAAVTTANQAQNLFAALGDLGGQARAWKNIGDALDDHGEHAEAEKAYQSAVGLFQRASHERGLAITLNNMGYAVKDQGDLERSAALFNRSREIARRIQDESIEAVALNGVGIVAWRKGQFGTARNAYEQALVIHKRRSDKSHAATVQGNLALVEQDMGDLKDAGRDLEASLTLLRETGDQVGIAQTVGNLGELSLRLGETQKAKARFAEQLALAGRMNDDKQRAYALDGLGRTVLMSGDVEGARKNIEQAFQIRSRTGEKGLAAETRLSLARTELEAHRFAEAAQQADSASTEFQAEKETDLMIAATQLGGRARAALGRTAEALSVALSTNIDNVSDAALRLTASIDLARTHLLLGQANAARILLERAHVEATRYGFTPEEIEIRMLLLDPNTSGNVLRQRKRIAQEARKHGLVLLAREAFPQK